MIITFKNNEQIKLIDEQSSLIPKIEADGWVREELTGKKKVSAEKKVEAE